MLKIKKGKNLLAASDTFWNLGCVYLFRKSKLTNQYFQTIIEDEAQLADPRILISRIALTLPERLTHEDQFHLEIEPEVDRDEEGSRWEHFVATGFSATKFLVCVQLTSFSPLLHSQYFFVCIGSCHPPPPDPKFSQFRAFFFFFWKFCKIICWRFLEGRRPFLWGILNPPYGLS